MTAATELAPTARQLSYLRVLAARTATTFASPASRAEASREIGRLRRLRAQPRDRPRESDDDGGMLAYATAAHADEVTGFGSSARWRSGPTRRQAPVPPTPHCAGETEIARYTVSAGARVLLVLREGETVRITDRPAVGHGPSYVLEESLSQSELPAVVADYLGNARDLDEVPMAPAALGRLLEAGSDV